MKTRLDEEPDEEKVSQEGVVFIRILWALSTCSLRYERKFP